MNTRIFAFAAALALTLSFGLVSRNVSAAQSLDHAAHGAAPAVDMTQSGPMAGMSHDAPAADAGQVYTAQGTLVSVDATMPRAVIKHAPVTALNWPAMTMGFAVEDAALLDGLKPGDAVRFDFRMEGTKAVIVDLERR
ncbi:copper-binding protein [uncultured Desulfovibrio sp.]|uniref:copper-binding protein n=1 Tax=Desulfovibrio legallii TaxID=571438 RepID=UPI002599D83E|nr:copper-binding protein [uncultured Desulfovibrio sp.]